uniref:Uncharacterized protein n=1 Tax=Knipowitschia caucasica TaxID=637954 RepID=A0AAV2M1C1_KNICA
MSWLLTQTNYTNHEEEEQEERRAPSPDPPPFSRRTLSRSAASQVLEKRPERLLEALFSWIHLRRESGLGLRRLAAELQYVKDNYRGKKPLSNSMARLGARCLSGAGRRVSGVLGGAQAGVHGHSGLGAGVHGPRAPAETGHRQV